MCLHFLEQFQEEVINMLTNCLFKSTRLAQVSIIVAQKNVLSKLLIIKNKEYTAEEEKILNNIMENVEKSLRFALGKG